MGMPNAPDRGRRMTLHEIEREIALNGPAETVDRPPAFTDEALALRFADLHQHDLRYVAGWGKWLSWTGQ